MFDEPNTPVSTRAATTVLVVDDEPTMRSLVARWLGSAGYRPVEAASAAAAVDWLQQIDVHLVTMDITMPGCCGLDLLAQIKQRWPETEVIMLTALRDTATAIQAMSLGAYGYLIKPVEGDELLFQAKKALERRELMIERRQYTRTLEKKVREQMRLLRHAHEETILCLLSASRYRDEETGGHIKRTGLHCELFAQVLGWPPDQIENFRMAAPMHDLGKIGIPDAILKKPGKLTQDEFEVMKTHTVIGAQMLEGSESSVLRMARDIALCHHEWWDGTGYPRGIAQWAIPESARILAIVDVFDALTHRRVYHEAAPEEQALAIMEDGRGSHFDPFLFSVFLGLVPEIRRIAAENPDDQMGEPAGELLLPATPQSAAEPPLALPAAVQALPV
ncbi:MAG: HD domain-containing phosphohydrolase [Thermoguttaceae bacterium]